MTPGAKSPGRVQGTDFMYDKHNSNVSFYNENKCDFCCIQTFVSVKRPTKRWTAMDLCQSGSFLNARNAGMCTAERGPSDGLGGG